MAEEKGDDDGFQKVIELDEEDRKMPKPFQPSPIPKLIKVKASGITKRICGDYLVYTNPCVFILSSIILWGFVIWSLSNPDLKQRISDLRTLVENRWSWFYVGSLNFFFCFCMYMMLGQYGDVVLGPEGVPPRFGYASWIAMLFSAGVGVGLFFWGVTEPLYYYGYALRYTHQYVTAENPYCHWGYNPTDCFAPSSRMTRAMWAQNFTWFHWGLAPSACYVVVGLPVAYYHYKHKLPMSIRTAFYPVFGNRINGWFGDLIDVSAIIGTVFGVCTSLGFGSTQMLQGFKLLDDDFIDDPTKARTKCNLIFIITLIATISVTTGLDYGIRRISECTFILGFVILGFIFFNGEPQFFLDLFVQVLGHHINHLPAQSLHAGAFEKGSEVVALGGLAGGKSNADPGHKWEVTGFTKGWTIFYWGWWISWSPFVGLFLAHISQGRTIREFVFGNLVIPTIITSLWFTIFGGQGLLMVFAGENLGLDCRLPCAWDANEGLAGSPDYTNPDMQRKALLSSVVGEHDWTGTYQFVPQAYSRTVPAHPYHGHDDNFVSGGRPADLTFYYDAYYPEYNTVDATGQPIVMAYDGLEGGCGMGPFDEKDEMLLLTCRTASSTYKNLEKPMFDVLISLTTPTQEKSLIFLAVISLVLYFVTSSDSASAVCDAMAAGGNPEPPLWQRIYWAFTEGIVAIVILGAGGDNADDAMQILKDVAILAGLPFCMVMLGMCFSFWEGLEADKYPEKKKGYKKWKVGVLDTFYQCFCFLLCCASCCGTCMKNDILPCCYNLPGNIFNYIEALAAFFLPCFVQAFSVKGVTHQSPAVMWLLRIFYYLMLIVPWTMYIVYSYICMEGPEGQTYAEHIAENQDKVYGNCGPNPANNMALLVYSFMVTIGAFHRTRIRDRYNIQGHFFVDWLMYFFFPLVSIYQEYKQTNDSITSILDFDGRASAAASGANETEMAVKPAAATDDGDV